MRAEIREQSRREGKGRTIVRFRNRSFPQFAFSRPELRKCHFLLAAVLSSLSPPSTLLRFPLSPSIVPGPNSVARARARTTFPRNVSSANQREILRGRFKGADVFPKRPRPAAILPREKIYSLSLSSQSFRSLFDAPNTAPILSRFKTIKTHSPRVEISIEISEGGQTFVPFCVVHDRSIVE